MISKRPHGDLIWSTAIQTSFICLLTTNQNTIWRIATPQVGPPIFFIQHGCPIIVRIVKRNLTIIRHHALNSIIQVPNLDLESPTSITQNRSNKFGNNTTRNMNRETLRIWFEEINDDNRTPYVKYSLYTFQWISPCRFICGHNHKN